MLSEKQRAVMGLQRRLSEARTKLAVIDPVVETDRTDAQKTGQTTIRLDAPAVLHIRYLPDARRPAPRSSAVAAGSPAGRARSRGRDRAARRNANARQNGSACADRRDRRRPAWRAHQEQARGPLRARYGCPRPQRHLGAPAGAMRHNATGAQSITTSIRCRGWSGCAPTCRPRSASSTASRRC